VNFAAVIFISEIGFFQLSGSLSLSLSLSFPLPRRKETIPSIGDAAGLPELNSTRGSGKTAGQEIERGEGGR